nr:hypothetical protein CFP56_28484 [Quercus suber]
MYVHVGFSVSAGQLGYDWGSSYCLASTLLLSNGYCASRIVSNENVFSTQLNSTHEHATWLSHDIVSPVEPTVQDLIMSGGRHHDGPTFAFEPGHRYIHSSWECDRGPTAQDEQAVAEVSATAFSRPHQTKARELPSTRPVTGISKGWS